LVGADLMAAAIALTATAAFGDYPLAIWALAVPALFVTLCKVAGLYGRDEHLVHKTTLDEAPSLFGVATLYTLLVFLAGDALVEGGSFGRHDVLVFWGLLLVGLVLSRALARRVCSATAGKEHCLILGNVDAARWLSVKLQRAQGARIDVVGRVPLGRADTGDGALPTLGKLDDIDRLIAEHRIHRVLIVPGRGESTDHRTLDAIRIVKRLGVKVTVLPRLLEVLGAAFEVDDVEGSTLLGVRRHGLGRSSRFVKRTFDLACATLAMMVFAPVALIIAVAIKIDSPGPVLFRQRRVGRDDEIFEMLKFRTMVDGAESRQNELDSRNEAGGGLFKIKDDPRITRVGRVLRHSALDEIPQLWNVLRGDMSLVGPRPLVFDEDCLIEGLHRQRMILPPGITGLWQIHGSARIPLDEMAKIDYLYGANWTLWSDIKILVRTVPFALGRRGL